MESVRSFRGIRIPQENMNLSREFRIKEKYSLNIRVEFDNIFNRLQLPTSAVAPGGVNLGNFAAMTGNPVVHAVQAAFLQAKKERDSRRVYWFMVQLFPGQYTGLQTAFHPRLLPQAAGPVRLDVM